MRSLCFWGGLDRVFELIVSQGGALGYVLLTLRGGSPLSGGLTFCPIN